MAMKRILTTISVLLLSVAVFAQRTGIREEVAADWNKVSGLDAVYNFDTPVQTPAPEGYEAFYVGHYGRHGSRYAYTSKAYTYLLDLLRQAEQEKNLTKYGKKLKVRMDELWDKVEYHIGELTPLGWEQQQRLAQRMVANFPAAFADGVAVDAVASSSVRSIMSMSSFCLSLAQECPKVKIYEHQGMIETQATAPNMGKNPLRYKGPESVFPYAEDPWGFFERRMPDYMKIYKRIFKKPEFVLEKSKDQLEYFYHFYMMVAGMNSVPEEVKADLSDIFTPEEYVTLWEVDNYLRFWEYYKYRTSCCSIVDDFIKKADAHIGAGEPGANLRFGHDHVMMSLMMIMDIDGFGTVPENNDELVFWWYTFRSCMATNLQMVFYRPVVGDGEVLVKLLFNEEEARFGSLETAQGPYYSWTALKSYLEARMAPLVTEKPVR